MRFDVVGTAIHRSKQASFRTGKQEVFVLCVLFYFMRKAGELTALKQQLLKRDTFDQFMQDLTKTHEKQFKVNQEIHHEINKMKSQMPRKNPYP